MKTKIKKKTLVRRTHHKKVAVFDIDGTIFRSSLVIELTEGLILAGVFPEKIRKIYSHEQESWIERKGSYEEYINAVVKAFHIGIKGVKEKDFLPVVERVVSFRKDRVYRYTRDLAKKLKKKSYYLLAISHSPMYVVGRFGRQMSFDKVYGGLLELDAKKRFTGGMLHRELIFDKAKILKRAIEKENLTLKGSIGVGDTGSDIPFLKMVENRICFNPNSALYREAKKRGWKIVVERKDVIYQIK